MPMHRQFNQFFLSQYFLEIKTILEESIAMVLNVLKGAFIAIDRYDIYDLKHILLTQF
jgi:hypothetical protein